MSSVPVEERIATTIIGRLEAGVDNPYTVVRVNRTAENWTPKNNTIVVRQGAFERAEEYDCPGNPPAIGYMIEFGVVCFVRQAKDATELDDTAMNEIVAATRKLITNSSDWYRMGSLCINTQIVDGVPFDPSEGAHHGAAFTVRCWYRVNERDPYEVRG